MTRHRFDPFSFLVGALAVAVAVLTLAGPVTLRLADLRIIGPVVLLLLGLALLASGSARGRSDVADAAVGEVVDDASHDEVVDDAPREETAEVIEEAPGSDGDDEAR